MKSQPTLRDAMLYFSDFEHCKEFMSEFRWPDGNVKCPQCGSEKVTYLAKPRVWKCYGKAHQADLLAEDRNHLRRFPIGLEKWLPCAWLVINCKNGISSYEVSRDLGVTQKTAWFMLHRIRLAMQDTSGEKFSGTVEADETFIGGKAVNMHLDRRTRLRMESRRIGGFKGKAIVMGLLDRHNRKVKIKALPNNRAYYVRTNIIENVEKGSTVYSDALKSYANVSVDGFIHDFVDHTEAYVTGLVHTNGLENFWSLLKRALKGTYISVEPFHLQAYADEQAFRYNHRKLTDAERFAIVLKHIVGRRLTYEQLTGKAQATQHG